MYEPLRGIEKGRSPVEDPGPVRLVSASSGAAEEYEISGGGADKG